MQVAIAALSAILLVGFLCLYYCLDPTNAPLAPKCGFKLLTGWDCPACGSQRALHSLLHGEWRRAIGYNPFMLISVPYFLAVAYTTFFRHAQAQRLRSIVQHKWVVLTFFWMVVAWWILRNTLWWQQLVLVWG